MGTDGGLLPQVTIVAAVAFQGKPYKGFSALAGPYDPPTGLPCLTNKNTGYPVKFEFQLNNEIMF